MGRFGMTELEARRCSPVSFRLNSKAHQVRTEEQRRMMALQAWMNQNVKATKKVGKNYQSLYKEFKEFYDAEKEFYDIFGIEKPKNTNILSLADKNRILSQRRRRGG